LCLTVDKINGSRLIAKTREHNVLMNTEFMYTHSHATFNDLEIALSNTLAILV
jgi:hypothetical protein